MSASRRAHGAAWMAVVVGAASGAAVASNASTAAAATTAVATAPAVSPAATAPAAGAAPTAQALSPRSTGLRFTPLRGGSAYVSGERAGWTVRLAAGAKPAAGRYSYRITRDEKAVVGTGTFDLSSGSAEIDLPRGEPGSFKVVVDYMAPPPPPPLTPAQARELNAALRTLLVDTDPSLAGILDKYPHYQLVPAWRFDVKYFMENRIATLRAVVRER